MRWFEVEDDADGLLFRVVARPSGVAGPWAGLDGLARLDFLGESYVAAGPEARLPLSDDVVYRVTAMPMTAAAEPPGVGR
jgi:hypothetical protein